MTDAAEIQGADSGADSRHIKVGKYDVAIANDQMPLVGVIASSIILLIAVGLQDLSKDQERYGMSLGIVALIVAIVQFLPISALDNFAVLINYFLFCWSFIGACIMTNGRGPFDETGNGYFACWGMTLFSGLAMGMPNLPGEVMTATSTAGMNAMLGLGACSIVVFIALLTDYKEWYWVRGEIIFAIIVCVLTMLMIVNFTYGRIKNIETLKSMEFPSLALFAVLWVIASCLTTFRGPFLVTSNGYLASWGGSILAVKACMASRVSTSTSTDEEE